MEKIYKKRYIYDPLYGLIYLPDFIWKVIPSPELQRLREVRLCNINSLCLIGGANINRYEHAIGTCYLAQECLNSWPPLNPISEKEQKNFLLAALLHDVVSAAFGHSLEYIESKEGFSHEKAFEYVVLGTKGESYRYTSTPLEPIFFGLQRELSSKLAEEDLKAIGKIVTGIGKFGPLINGIIDLDNIDNVFRFAYHIGLVKSGDIPLKLAKSLWTKNSELIVKNEAIPLIEEWHKLRKKLYEFLLLNPEEFSAKCMLSEAIELAKTKSNLPFNWYDTDYELLMKLSNVPLVREKVKNYLFSIDITFKEDFKNHILSKKLKATFEDNKLKISAKAYIKKENDEWEIRDMAQVYFIKDGEKELRVYKVTVSGTDISTIVSRLMKGDLYGCIGIYSTEKTDKYEIFTNINKKTELEKELSEKIRALPISSLKHTTILLHPIIDKNKIERQVRIQTDDGQISQIGRSSNQLLIGVFFKNVNLNMYNIAKFYKDEKIGKEIYAYLADTLDDPTLGVIELYAEAAKNE